MRAIAFDLKSATTTAHKAFGSARVAQFKAGASLIALYTIIHEANGKVSDTTRSIWRGKLESDFGWTKALAEKAERQAHKAVEAKTFRAMFEDEAEATAEAIAKALKVAYGTPAYWAHGKTLAGQKAEAVERATKAVEAKSLAAKAEAATAKAEAVSEAARAAEAKANATQIELDNARKAKEEAEAKVKALAEKMEAEAGDLKSEAEKAKEEANAARLEAAAARKAKEEAEAKAAVLTLDRVDTFLKSLPVDVLRVLRDRIDGYIAAKAEAEAEAKPVAEAVAEAVEAPSKEAVAEAVERVKRRPRKSKPAAEAVAEAA